MAIITKEDEYLFYNYIPDCCKRCCRGEKYTERNRYKEIMSGLVPLPDKRYSCNPAICYDDGNAIYMCGCKKNKKGIYIHRCKFHKDININTQNNP